MLIVIMGVAGSGKTTVATALAEALQWPLYDADDYHPPANIAKMTRGEPLTDADRAPWLAALAGLLRAHALERESAILACSALKQRYRDALQVDASVRFVYLRGDYDLLLARLMQRTDHYMKPNMLASQLADLEPPREAVVIDIRAPLAEMVAEILARLDLRPPA
ncbi:MAG: gluconokinase [Anaerolineales bacterium]|nr:gluconokinase [Anaerolineales bacterium]